MQHLQLFAVWFLKSNQAECHRAYINYAFFLELSLSITNFFEIDISNPECPFEQQNPLSYLDGVGMVCRSDFRQVYSYSMA